MIKIFQKTSTRYKEDFDRLKTSAIHFQKNEPLNFELAAPYIVTKIGQVDIFYPFVILR